MKRFSTSLIIREMQIKTTMRYHFMPVRMAAIKSLQAINAGEGVEKREPSYTVGGNANQYSHYGEQCGDSLKSWKQNCHTTQQSHCWAHTPRKPELKETRVPQCSSQHCSSLRTNVHLYESCEIIPNCGLQQYFILFSKLVNINVLYETATNVLSIL